MQVTVTALMATTPARWSFMPAALDSFYKQKYPAPWRVQLLIDPHPTKSLGAKLNDMVAATNSDFYLIWDDDDLYSPTRLARQIEPLLNGYDLTGTSKILYRDLRNGEEWLYTGQGTWFGAFAFRRALWEKVKFKDISSGVDSVWQTAIHPCKRLDLADPTLFTATIHDSNTCRKHTAGSDWTRLNG